MFALTHMNTYTSHIHINICKVFFLNGIFFLSIVLIMISVITVAFSWKKKLLHVKVSEWPLKYSIKSHCRTASVQAILNRAGRYLCHGSF